MSMHETVPVAIRPPLLKAGSVEAILRCLAVGIFAGIAVTYLRTPLHMPGHKVLLWLAPILACRLRTKIPGGASVATLGTIASALLLGGNIAGGAIMMPLVLVAGIIVDASVRLIERHRLSWWPALMLLLLAGIAANLVCFIKRLFDPVGTLFSDANVRDLLSAGMSYAIFGLLAGLLGALAGLLLNRWTGSRLQIGS